MSTLVSTIPFIDPENFIGSVAISEMQAGVVVAPIITRVLGNAEEALLLAHICRPDYEHDCNDFVFDPNAAHLSELTGMSREATEAALIRLLKKGVILSVGDGRARAGLNHTKAYFAKWKKETYNVP